MDNKKFSNVSLARVLVILKQNRKQVIFFLLCICISTLLWLTIKLNRDYIRTLTFRVHISGIEKNEKFRSLQPDTILLDIKAQGYQLLFNEITRFRNLDVNISRTLLEPSTRNNVYSIPAQTLMTRMARRFPASTELLNVKPDTLFFRIESIISKKIPVKSEVAITPKKEYYLTNDLIIVPDSVTIKGESSIVDKISSISTKKTEIKQVDKNFSFKIDLVNPHPDKIAVSVNNVTISGELTRYLKRELIVPVHLPDSISIKGTPARNNVSISFIIPVNRLNSFNPGSVKAIAKKIVTENNNSYIEIEVLRPAYLQDIVVTPDKILFEPKTE